MLQIAPYILTRTCPISNYCHLRVDGSAIMWFFFGGAWGCKNVQMDLRTRMLGWDNVDAKRWRELYNFHQPSNTARLNNMIFVLSKKG